MTHETPVANRAADLALTALGPAVWGSTYLVTTELLPPGRPLLAATVRALPAGLALLAAGRTLPTGRWWWRALVLGVVNIGAFFFLLFVAAYLLPGGVAAVILTLQPVLVLVLAAVVLGDRIRLAQVVACVLGIGGVALLVLQPSARLDPVGVLAGLGGAVCMATGIVLTKRWGRPDGTSLLTFTGWQLAAGGLVLAPATLAVEGLPDRISGANVAGFAYLGVVGALIAYALWFRGLERLPALAVSFLAFASPLVATVLGYLFLDQSFTPWQAVGAATVVGAVVLAQQRIRPAPGTTRPLDLPVPREL
ncbi:EamA family transporter [Amycolatopsis dendrobii]|uniref:EamA family transporter n=1 Tax=Amycolatopsis dendrobii TaxID=2760662 RepID=A0A7W3W5T1_9PSEU|nr:EamA family transporter [Amycolatopsis dendrobii]MBB1159376.1 EamA family transporter [Amycolatopsis dendrobii]